MERNSEHIVLRLTMRQSRAPDPACSLRPNFRPMKVDEHFSIERFAVGVANELMLALECLIEK